MLHQLTFAVHLVHSPASPGRRYTRECTIKRGKRTKKNTKTRNIAIYNSAFHSLEPSQHQCEHLHRHSIPSSEWLFLVVKA